MKTKTTKANQNPEAKGRAQQPDTAKRPHIDLKLRRENRMLDTESLLAKLRTEAPQFFNLAEVVGEWVWIEFEGEQPAEITTALSQFGFHYNNSRQVWQHPCGTIEEREAYDPRKRYGSRFAADQQAA